MIDLSDKIATIKADPSYDDHIVNTLYLWVSNTGECYTKIMGFRSEYLNSSLTLDGFISRINTICLLERHKLQRTEEDLGRANNASCMGAALYLANYYLNVYQD